ncbi:MAG TPA: decarboxylating 6-phosphogluconate dehydrogenase [Usitatibacter sp.]|nr:decarboxylating 6-phosphogluconate dehydrogenase [Usitatibacter sp.]
MHVGMVGLGRMGANMARRLMRAGHTCVVHDVSAETVKALVADGGKAAGSLADLAKLLAAPRVVWVMVPAAAVDGVVEALVPLLAKGDLIVDGGNTHFPDDVRRAASLAARGIAYVDVGTSGGVWGLENGYCLTVGGEAAAVERVRPIFEALAPKGGFLHCGSAGAGHFVKMVHNGIEYGLMAAYAEGFNLLKGGGYDIDIARVADVWRHGSVIRSWLLDLTASALSRDPRLTGFAGHVSDSGEGRWTVKAAVDAGVPTPVLSAALFSRFSSRGEDDFANRLLSAMRKEFGGHVEPS